MADDDYENAITHENLSSFLNPWSESKSESKSTKPEPSTTTPPPPPSIIISTPIHQSFTSRRSHLHLSSTQPALPTMPSNLSASQETFPPPAQRHHQRTFTSSFLPPPTPPSPPTSRLPLGSLRNIMLDRGALELQQVIDVVRGIYPAMTEKQVVAVMNTDVQRDYLRSMILSRGGVQGVGSGEGWRFLWKWR